MEVVNFCKQLWAGIGILGKQKFYLALQSFAFTVQMHVCNVTEVSTRMSVHTLGNWDQSIIHDLSRALVPDIKDAGAGVAE